ncbi:MULTISPECIES: hypothetical protein [unclassified Streptomyces]|uniref:hypothetical protein n=1 Tax=Streptomyces sp. NPDC055082 TaxID=3365718 RepID=UPI0037D488FD
MRQIDLPLQIDHLHQLGADFAAMHSSVTVLDARPGSELLQQLAPKILSIQELVGRALVRLTALDGSQYAAVPGSRTSMETLSEVVASAAVAASQLAKAVADNPLESAGLADSPPADINAIRQVRDAEATRLLSGSLITAAHHLDLCATCCQVTASGITRDLKDHPELAKLPQLTDAQYTALDRIAQGGTRHFMRLNGSASTVAGDGKTVHSPPVGVLLQYRLIRFDARTPPMAGQDVTVTAAGSLVLDIQKPGPDRVASGKVPGPRQTGGRRR